MFWVPQRSFWQAFYEPLMFYDSFDSHEWPLASKGIAILLSHAITELSWMSCRHDAILLLNRSMYLVKVALLSVDLMMIVIYTSQGLPKFKKQMRIMVMIILLGGISISFRSHFLL